MGGTNPREHRKTDGINDEHISADPLLLPDVGAESGEGERSQHS